MVGSQRGGLIPLNARKAAHSNSAHMQVFTLLKSFRRISFCGLAIRSFGLSLSYENVLAWALGVAIKHGTDSGGDFLVFAFSLKLASTLYESDVKKAKVIENSMYRGVTSV